MASSRWVTLRERLMGYPWHAPSVHFHSALFPTSLILLIIYLITHESSLEKASYYVLSFGVLMLAGSIIAGFFDWRMKYNSAKTKIFQLKIYLSTVLLVLGIALVIWRWLSPQLMKDGVATQALYIAGLLGAGLLVVWIGSLGGKLIFPRK